MPVVMMPTSMLVNTMPFEVWVKTEDGKTDVTYPDLPYVAWMDHDGDFSWNSNNYVHGPTARIRPRK